MFHEITGEIKKRGQRTRKLVIKIILVKIRFNVLVLKLIFFYLIVILPPYLFMLSHVKLIRDGNKSLNIFQKV